MQRLIKGLVLATRVLRKNPTFALGAILALALGIGANSLVFSVVNALIFHALPFPSPDRLVHVERTFETQRALRGRLSMPEVKDIEDRSQIFKAIGSYSPNAGMSFLDGTTPITVHSAFVSASIFSVFGVNPLFGRTFTPEDMYPGDAQVSVLSYSFWREHFSHDEDPIGKTITLDSKAYVVVGVMPQYFNFPPEQFDVWLPESNGSAESLSRNISNCIVIARLRDGSTLSEAQSELKSIAKWISQAHIEDRGSSLGVAFLDEEIIGPVKTGLMVLFGAVALVLLIACSNVASLVLARNVNRQREFAIRYALGASRGNIIRQLLTESLLLSVLGGSVAILFTFVGIRVIRSILPPNLARLGHLEVNNWVLAFTFVVSLLAGLLSGSVYSFPSVRSDSKSPLLGIASDRGVGADVKPRRLQRTLAVCQLTLAVILVIAAGLLVRSLLGLLTVDFGFDSRNLLTVNVDPKSFARLSDAQEALFYRQVIDGVQSVPGVRNAAWTSSAPLGGAGLGTGFRLGSDFHAGSVQAAMQAFQEDLRDGRYADLQVVSSNYFQTVGIPLISGRPFSDRDNDAARPVISINRAMARRFWPNQDPIGNLVDVGEGGCICEIVGIVGDSRDSDLRTEARPKIYRPYPQGDGPLSVLLIRTAVNPLLMRNSIVGRIKRVNDTARITSIVTMDDVISRSVIDQKFQTTLLGFFATLATLLAVLGVYSVGSYAVTLRTREFGIRMALGANKKDVSRLVMRQAVNMTVTGVVLGLAGAFSLAHLMAKILYGVKPTDPLTFIGVAVLLSIVSLLASYLPACRASGTDIIAALRH